MNFFESKQRQDSKIAVNGMFGTSVSFQGAQETNSSRKDYFLPTCGDRQGIDLALGIF